MDLPDLRLVYITAKDAEEARQIGRDLVERRLAACCNILEPMSSIYWWQGAIQEDREAVLIAKTRAALVEDLIARVRAIHSYQVPCVLSLPVETGNKEYLTWLADEARPR